MVKETHVTLSSPKGMKQTEIGLIPKDWFIDNLKNIVDENRKIRYGVVQPGTYDRNGVLLIRGQDYSFGWNKVENFFKISHLLDLRFINARVQAGDLLLTIVGNGTGNVAIIPNYIKEANITQTTARICSNGKKTLNKYLYYYLDSQNGKNEIKNYIKGAAQPGLNICDVEKFKVILPPLAEQEAIAAALSDCDAWIESIEAVIAKKRLIKQGAMQELLTPKADWEVKKLGELTEIYTGKKNNQDKIENGTFPFFVRSQKIERINSYSFDGEAILVPGEGNLGSIFHYINGKFDFHQRVYKVSDFKGIDGKYTYWYFRMYFGQHAMQNTVKATVDSIRLPTLLEFEVSFPKSLSEQTQIATVLSDMDAELEALGQKLNKARQIKQGMMQELLTGRVRLV